VICLFIRNNTILLIAASLSCQPYEIVTTTLYVGSFDGCQMGLASSWAKFGKVVLDVIVRALSFLLFVK